MRILIAEDNFTDRLILKKIVEAEGHQVVEAHDGAQALELVSREVPDLVFLDAMMPTVDGFEVAQKLREEFSDRYLPIIFITSLTDTDSIVKCIEAGGDDFFSKPFNRVVLNAKISAFGRTRQLYDTVTEQKKKIEFHTEHLIQEQKIAKRIFDNIAHGGALNEPYIRHYVSPMSIFNGDILLAAKRPLGGINILAGDFTGHGLPASIGAMPTSDIFFGMTAKGFDLFEIIKEINSRLHSILPVGFFCCAVAAEIHFDANSLKVWNGGLPEAFILNRDEGTVAEIPSNHLPLGILSSDRFNSEMDIRSFNDGDSLFIYSDGVIEAENADGEMFGRDRLLIELCEGAVSGDAFDRLAEAIERFQIDETQADDISYIEIKNHREIFEHQQEPVNVTYTKSGPSDSEISITLGPDSIRQFNPLPMLTQYLMDIGNLRSFRTQVLTILTEIYSNALEHGVLQLSSSLKKSADGFAEYYRQREARIAALKEGSIVIFIKHENKNNGGVLTIRIDDSGSGFDYLQLEEEIYKKQTNGSSLEDNYLSGRGFPLIAELADSITFSNQGSSVTVVYQWQVSE
ncbi:MAG: SpoIIE family protein phosphatase [Gammaproteobacteria bacterium]|nr:SpoIIE family protein phosphatase [Gammaproteobacteria bacterium]